mgnify:CR=1 FL=1
MKNLEILKGKINDATKTYYLANMRPDMVYTANEVLSDDSCMSSHKITLRYDSGWYPGTLQELHANQYNYVLDELLNMGIIAKCKDVCGCIGYCSGKSY